VETVKKKAKDFGVNYGQQPKPDAGPLFVLPPVGDKTSTTQSPPKKVK